MAKSNKKPPVRKKTVSARQKKKAYDCDDIEQYLDKAIDRVKKEILPKIDIIDKRDKDQYDAAKKIMIDVATIEKAKQEHMEKNIVDVKSELGVISNRQDNIVNNINGSLEGLHTKIDKHIVDESDTFKTIQSTLLEINDHGTRLAQDIDNKLNNVEVNGGTYPFNEALKHLYSQSTETHKKLNEVITLVEPIQARRRWAMASRELIKKNGVLHFIFSTKIGAIIATITFVLILNTILVDVFQVNLDIGSIFKWLASFGS